MFSPLRHTHIYGSDVIPAVPGEARYGQTRRLAPGTAGSAGLAQLDKHEAQRVKERIVAVRTNTKIDSTYAMSAERRARAFYLGSHTERRELQLNERITSLEHALATSNAERDALRRELAQTAEAKVAALAAEVAAAAAVAVSSTRTTPSAVRHDGASQCETSAQGSTLGSTLGPSAHSNSSSNGAADLLEQMISVGEVGEAEGARESAKAAMDMAMEETVAGLRAEVVTLKAQLAEATASVDRLLEAHATRRRCERCERVICSS